MTLVNDSVAMRFRALYPGLAFFFLFACSRPAQLPKANEGAAPSPSPETEAKTAPTSASTPPMKTNKPVAQPTPDRAVSPAETARSLQTKFLNNADSGERVEIVHALGDLNNAEAVAAIGALFQNEQDGAMKLEMLATLGQMEGEMEAKFPTVVAALRPEQPREVRDAAIDALAVLDDPRALQMLQSLMADADPEIRESAREALEGAIESRKLNNR